MTLTRRHIWALLRLALGWIFLWTFLDKLVGLGFSTTDAQSWLSGASPTKGFLTFGTHGPFVDMFQAIAGHPVVDWLYMLGLGLTGLALILGIGVRVAAVSGSLMMALIYAAASLPPEHNPFLDEHLIYILVLIGIALARAGQTWGLGVRWTQTPLVRRWPFLE